MKKKQPQTIMLILIILLILVAVIIVFLVLAAVVIVWQSVGSAVNENDEEAQDKSLCFGVTMEVVSTNATSNETTVKRGSGSDDVNVSGYRIFVNGVQGDDVNVNLGPVETNTYTISSGIEDGDEVYVAAKLKSGAVCAESNKVTV